MVSIFQSVNRKHTFIHTLCCFFSITKQLNNGKERATSAIIIPAGFDKSGAISPIMEKIKIAVGHFHAESIPGRLFRRCKVICTFFIGFFRFFSK